MATIEERLSATNSVKAQLASVVSDLEHMTSGNFMHHRASAKLLAGCALKNIDKVIAEERERCIKAAQDAHCKRFCPWDNKRCKLLGGDWDYECEDRETIYYEIMYGDTTIPSNEG